MNNPLRELINGQDEPQKLAVYRVADKAGLTRSNLYAIYNRPEMGNVETDTLEKVAAVLGKRVVISFEPIEAA